MGQPELRLRKTEGGAIDIDVYGACGQMCRLLGNSTLSDWQALSTNQAPAGGALIIHQDSTGASYYYRVAVP